MHSLISKEFCRMYTALEEDSGDQCPLLSWDLLSDSFRKKNLAYFYHINDDCCVEDTERKISTDSALGQRRKQYWKL